MCATTVVVHSSPLVLLKQKQKTQRTGPHKMLQCCTHFASGIITLHYCLSAELPIPHLIDAQAEVQAAHPRQALDREGEQAVVSNTVALGRRHNHGYHLGHKQTNKKACRYRRGASREEAKIMRHVPTRRNAPLPTILCCTTMYSMKTCVTQHR